MRYLTLILLLLSVPLYAGCPEGFAEVPSYPPYSNQPYCVMQNEARVPKIQVSKAWNYIDQSTALSECIDAVPQGDILVNALWQSIVLQAEVIDANWTGGSVGVGDLKTDLVINNGLSTFYDIGDGHWEFVTGVSPPDFTATPIYLLSDSDPTTFTINGLTGNAKFHFGPAGTYAQPSGLGVTTNRASIYIMRGGDDSEPGAFGAAMNHAGEAASDVSFRCSCPLYACGV